MSFLLTIVPALYAGPPWPKDQPEAGYYWAAAQYEIRLGRLRELLLTIAQGESPVSGDTLAEAHARAKLLESRTSLLVAPSHLPTLLQSVAGYGDAAPAIKALQLTLRIDMQKAQLLASDARDLLSQIDRVMPAVIRLSDAARERELTGMSELYDTFRQQQRERVAYTAAIWALLGIGAAWILRAREHDRELADRLESALDAETQAKSLLREEIAAKGQFASMVNHELRSPLQVVVSSISLLSQQLAPPERRNTLARLQRATQMMDTQLSDLAVLARGGVEPPKLEPVSFEASMLVEDVANVLEPGARRKGIQFVVQVPPQPVFVRADAQRISQILTNLISNAVKYTRDGTVQILLREPDPAPRHLELIVADTGPGLSPHQMQRLQAKEGWDESVLPRQDGSGIGLNIVRTVVEHLGGSVQVHSPEGFGTTFRVRLPVVFEDPDGIPNDASEKLPDQEPGSGGAVGRLTAQPSPVRRSATQTIAVVEGPASRPAEP